MALSSNSIIPITKHRDDPRNVAVPPLWVDRRRVEPRASKSATDATAGIWRPHCHDVRSCRTAIPGAGIAPCLIGMDACVGGRTWTRCARRGWTSRPCTLRVWTPPPFWHGRWWYYGVGPCWVWSDYYGEYVWACD